MKNVFIFYLDIWSNIHHHLQILPLWLKTICPYRYKIGVTAKSINDTLSITVCSLARTISPRASISKLLAHFSVKAEYRSLASAANDLTWILFILRDIGVAQLPPSLLFSDNMLVLHVTTNLFFHACTQSTSNLTATLFGRKSPWLHHYSYVSFNSQVPDIFTKPLARDLFLNFWTKLDIWK